MRDDEASGLISGRFRLGELLGTGGSASVFSAVEIAGGSVLALKILHPHLSRSTGTRDAFFAEARAAVGLRHQNIVAVRGVGVHDLGGDARAWIALDLAPGVSLAEYVEAHGALAVSDALTLAEGVLLALAVAHAAGLMHRDVSPANIMIDPGPDGSVPIDGVRLLDFGLADAAGRPALGSDVLRSPPEGGTDGPRTPTTRPTPGVLGSANYLSPEQALGEPVDERGDVYQVGGVLHFALTGRPPFVRDSTALVLRAHVQAPPPVPSVLNSGIPRAVDRIVVRALTKDPAGRFRSADEMREAVEIAAAVCIGRSGRVAAAAPSGLYRADLAAATGADPTRVLAPATSTPRQELTDPSWARSGRPRRGGGLWIATLCIAVGAAVAWAASSGGGTPASVAVTTSVPSATAAAVPGGGLAIGVAATPVPLASIRVPDLQSLTLVESRAALSEAGLALGDVVTQNSPWPADIVLGSTPAAGTNVRAGMAVNVVVASGSNAVPAVLGLASDAAVAALRSAGFAPVMESRPDAGSPAGTVLAAVPDESAVLRLGSTITLFVAVSPVPAPTPEPRPTLTPSPAPTPLPTPSPTPAPTPTPASP